MNPARLELSRIARSSHWMDRDHAVGSIRQLPSTACSDSIERRVPTIASKLEEHPHAAGGITDLWFRGIRIELKYEDQSLLSLQACEKYADQLVSYVVGTGKRVGILCVLDNTRKTSAAFPAEEGIGILTRPAKKNAVHVVTVLIQGALARPSDLAPN